MSIHQFYSLNPPINYIYLSEVKHTHTCTHNHTHTPENPSQKEIGPLYSINFHIFLLAWGKNNNFIKIVMNVLT